jgi:hypothetical protein
VTIRIPEDFRLPEGGLNIRWPDTPLQQEARLLDYKLYAALAYCRANRLNHTVIDSPHARFGIVTCGKAYLDTRQALADLGLDEDTCRQVGLRLFKCTMSGRSKPVRSAPSPKGWKRSWWSRRSASSSSTSSRRNCSAGSAPASACRA